MGMFSILRRGKGCFLAVEKKISGKPLNTLVTDVCFPMKPEGAGALGG